MDYTIIFGPDDLGNILFPGVVHELKINTKQPELFKRTITSPSRYKLPTYIIPDEFINCITTDLSKTLLFIHVWFIHNNTHIRILDNSYDTYEDFFQKVLTYIVITECDPSIKEQALLLRDRMKNYYIYMGKYHGNFLSSIYKTSELIRLIFWLFIIIKML